AKNRHMQVDTTRLEYILNKATTEDSDNKRLEKLESTYKIYAS
ncbi:hypothetical protein INT46_011478, partial [Mucor plumbeus]